MKKELKLFGILLVSGLILGACSNQKKGEKTSNESEKTSSVSSVRTKKSQEKSQSSSSVKKDASTSSAGSVSDASSSSGSKLEARETSTSSPTLDLNNKRLSELNASIRNNLGNILLPSANGLDSAPGYLNMRYTGDANNFSVDYIVSYSPYGLNDGATSGHVPYATFVKKTYDSESAAANDVPYQPSDSSRQSILDTTSAASWTRVRDNATCNGTKADGHSSFMLAQSLAKIRFRRRNTSLACLSNTTYQPQARKAADSLNQPPAKTC